ncbi:acyl-CoA dehydrogenase family protein [uncultured Bartonella sp.]|uniref:acyl-CoA dehydrogenase family protein n=1 Tax=uncultured Bartonella sp. TaxID=104108 RepID=UPI0025ECA6AB|nr:acyl-CoA dehydrogenase family protein [uncultured Bartonella sp.]
MSTLPNQNIMRKNAFLDDAVLFRFSSLLPTPLLAGFEEIGSFVASREAQDLARLANIHRPVLRRENEWGDGIEQMETHPAYHALSRRSRQAGLCSSLWENGPAENGVRYQARTIRLFLMAGLETGHLNAITSTSAGISALLSEADLFSKWQNVLLSHQHDYSSRPISSKRSAILTFACDEVINNLQGLSPVSTATRVSFDSTSGRDIYRIDAVKQSVLNPTADGFFVTAEVGGQKCCFFISRFLETGALNGNISVDYLIHRAGECSAAEGQVSFANSLGWLIGKIGEGDKVIRDVETMTQFDQAVISAGVLRAALQAGINFFRRFNPRQVLPPLTERIFADLSLDIVAAQCLVMRLARAFDHAVENRSEAAFARIMTPIVAIHISGLVVPVVGEIIAQMGPQAFLFDSRLARMLSDAPVRTMKGNGGNDIVVDTIRLGERAPGLFQGLLDQIGRDIGAAGPKTVEILHAAAQVAASDIGAGRLFIEQMAYAAAAGALKQTEMNHITAAYIESRLGGQWRSSYGMLSARHHAGHILDTLYPAV